MPRIFGLIPNNEELPFAQQFYVANTNTVVANNGNAVLALGTFTMPFAGELFASLTAAYYFIGFQQVTTGLGPSTPAPSSYANMNHVAFSPNNGTGYLRGQLPLGAAWTGLAKGQIVTLNIGVTIGGGGPNVTYEAVAGTVRAVRVGL